MNKKQKTAVWVTAAYILLVFILTFVQMYIIDNIIPELRKASLEIPLYIKLFIELRIFLVNLFFPILIIAGILIFILRDRQK